jgi:Cu-Zn family superoxide dismutase
VLQTKGLGRPSLLQIFPGAGPGPPEVPRALPDAPAVPVPGRPPGRTRPANLLLEVQDKPQTPIEDMTAVAVFRSPAIVGEAVATPECRGTRLRATFSALPAGKHGFHIHVAGDLRGEGCAGACAHLHMGSDVVRHGGRPGTRRGGRGGHERHSGDLGNIELRAGKKAAAYSYFLGDLKPSDLWGRALIVHADEDDLGHGEHEDSGTTGHSGARIGCAIFGRGAACSKTRRHRKHAAA